MTNVENPNIINSENKDKLNIIKPPNETKKSHKIITINEAKHSIQKEDQHKTNELKTQTGTQSTKTLHEQSPTFNLIHKPRNLSASPKGSEKHEEPHKHSASPKGNSKHEEPYNRSASPKGSGKHEEPHKRPCSPKHEQKPNEPHKRAGSPKHAPKHEEPHKRSASPKGKSKHEEPNNRSASPKDIVNSTTINEFKNKLDNLNKRRF